MELSLITDEVSQDPEEAIDLALGHGLRKVAVRSVWGTNVALLDRPAVDRLAKLFARRGIGVSSVMSPLFKCHVPGAADSGLVDPHFVGLPPVFDQHVAVAGRLGQIADALSTPLVRIFTFLDPSPAGRPCQVGASELATMREAVTDWPSGVEPVIENEFVCKVKTLPELAAFGRLSGWRVVADPCNGLLAGDSDGLEHMTAELLAATADVHVKDRSGARYVPVGDGELRWQQIFERLRQLGYGGTVTLESHLRGDLDGVEASLRALTRLVAS
ncbi:sugar phosphate isomerase/epimerase family protein [Streptacidiphilus neutrinimicus]|uniref:sugar phosphate isomerase/epimerase family protein n=1 Tax=Streptacidiphilus neutrinimicus TaxID=105420 RepID=UPI0005AB8829|nr:TIM barrel protein [Streptacidiphilus neutrinimicus]